MKNASTFKSLIDIVYILFIILIVLFVVIVPFAGLKMGGEVIAITDLTLVHWIYLIATIIGYIIFIRGLYFLRNVAGHLLGRNRFEIAIIENLKKSGRHFVLTGAFFLLTMSTLWLINLFGGRIDIVFSTNALLAIFLILIGLFFIIQSSTLYEAKEIKEENELMV